MFNRLPESKPQRQRRAGGALVSTVVHAVFIALAVRATGLKAEVAPRLKPVITPIYVAPPRDPAPPVSRTTSATSSGPSVTAPEAPVFPVIDPVIIPGIPVPGPAIDLAAWERRGHESIAGPGGQRGGDGTPNVAGDAPRTKEFVDVPILAIPGTSSPRYPSMLQSAGIEGDVRAQFVVDTLGRVERESIRILDETQSQFAVSVREALLRARFKPAEAGGRKVRQLAEQVFTFRITR